MDAESRWLLQLAQWAGANALPLFLLALVLLLAVAWAGWRLLHRHVLPRVLTVSPQRAWLVLAMYFCSGFLIIVTGAWVFAEVAEELHEKALLGQADQLLSDAVRLSLPLQAAVVFATVTHFGDTLTLTALCIVVALVLLVRRRRLLAVAWVAALAGNGLLNTTLKQVFERVRPLHDDGLMVEDGFSFPSGHTSGSVVAFGMLAYLGLRLLPGRWHLPLLLGAVALAITVGASRVFLRVHFASDVIAGFASGTAWLAVCIASTEAAHWYRRRGLDRNSR